MSTTSQEHRAAVVGIGCRLPGGIHGPTQLWEALVQGRDLVGEIPPDRWKTMTQHLHVDQRPDHPWPAGVLEDIASFDADFFGIGAAEAQAMDPQQRLLLEVVIEALADAGIAPATLAGKRVGVYVGAASFDHATLVFTPGRRTSMHTASGAGMAVLANRISYCLDLRGPSLSIDTACSSSLVAAHQARRDLEAGEVELAVVAGANLLANPSITAAFVDGGVLSPTGCCKPFDARADGYVRSEGVVAVVLKPQAQAQADTDRVYAVVTGSAVNQDGHTAGLYAPSQAAQQALLERALAEAGVEPGEVDYVEAHGTGTKSGDRVEGRALAAALAEGRSPRHPLLVGSIKSTLGHTEGAAGLTGLIKAALMLHHGQIPPTLHHHQLRPALAEFPLRVPTQLEPWPQRGSQRVAGVSAFGFGGTNACLVLHTAVPPAEPASVEGSEAAEPCLVPLSAATSPRLHATAGAWAPGVERENDLGAVAATAVHRRDVHYPQRAAILACSTSAAAEALRALAAGQPHPAVIGPHTAAAEPRALVWVFAGHGCHHPAMASRCYGRFSAFAEGFDAAHASLEACLDSTPWRPGKPITTFEQAQHAIWLTQIAQAAQWRAWGYAPTAVVGHSIGEVAAAHVAGALPLEQAARVVATRSALLARTARAGGLLVVDLPTAQVEEAISAAGSPETLVVAACNGPHTTVVSGAEPPLEALRTRLALRGVQARRVADDVPAHSPLVATASAQLHTRLANLTAKPPQLPFHPTAHGAHPGEGLCPAGDYWAAQLRQKVDFLATTRRLAITYPKALWVELGGRSTLAAPVRETLAEHQPGSPLVVAAGRLGQGDDAALLAQLAHLYTHGPVPTRWPHPRQRPVGLPVAWHHPDASPPSAELADSDLRTLLADLCVDQAALQQALTRLVATITASPTPHIDPHIPLVELGVSSIATIELRAQLRTLTGQEIPATLLGPHTSIATLTHTLSAHAKPTRPAASQERP